MGLGPNSASLLVKLGLKPAHLMSEVELEALVSKQQAYRSIQRALGRIKRIEEDDGNGGRKAIRKKPNMTLESLGFLPAVCIKLRAGGKTDAAIIMLLKQKGVL